MRVVRAADQPRIRWRNDGGWTRDVARDSPREHDFSWRISIADVEVDGPFSRFDGFDRLLVLLEGAGMDLVCIADGTTMELRPKARSARFAGETAITAELLDGATTDFNVIWDRSRFSLLEHDDWRNRTIGGGDGSIVVVHVLSGAMENDRGVRGVAGDTMIDDSGRATRLGGDAEAIVVVLQPLANANHVD
ncbi:MAG TPA: HutD family protein [Ilumatobacteraceae bacterium]|nr:HutD family protein [Ilumatobacteraceae bacterium]HRB02639.1 HutD family protein [Ilumatobacteraceae bacterium]